MSHFAKLLESCGAPHERIPFIIVGGTNGKGTTATMLAALATAAGKRVGLFTSPHILNERERIAVDGRCITQQELQALRTRLRELQNALHITELNFFQMWTLLAWMYFDESRVDLAILEVGVGGRLDPTNTGTPLASAIVSIDLDHTELLGDTRGKILMEKLPIARAGRPLVFGETDAGLQALARQWCAANRVPLHLAEPMPNTLPVHLRICRAVALTVAGILPAYFGGLPQASAALALDNVRLPARRQRVGRLLLDIAHNDAALAELAAQQNEAFTLILAQPRNRLWGEGALLLARRARRILCPHMVYQEDGVDYFRDAGELRDWLGTHGIAAEICVSLQAALQVCQESASILCGSSRLCGEALRIIGVDTAETPLYS